MNAQADASSLNHFELFVLPHRGRGRLLVTHVQAIDLTEVSHWAYLPRLLYSILPLRARCQVCVSLGAPLIGDECPPALGACTKSALLPFALDCVYIDLSTRSFRQLLGAEHHTWDIVRLA